jgi:ParB family transcriptional regulator, chromosome partitioning protein
MTKTSTAEDATKTSNQPQKKRPGLRERMQGSLVRGLTEHQTAIQEGFQGETENWIARDISIDLIDPCRFQPRKNPEKSEIAELAHSIDEQGLIQPIVVRPNGSRYELVCGERRKLAHEMLGKRFIKAHVANLTDEEASALALCENLNRKDLTDFEIYLSIKRHREAFGVSTDNHKSLGLGRTEYFRFMAFDVLPQSVIDLLQSKPGLISGHCVENAKTYLTEMERRTNYDRNQVDKHLKTIVQMAIDTGRPRITNLAAEIESRLFPDANVATPKSLEREGKKIGDIQVKGKFVRVKLNSSDLDADKLARLEEFLISLYEPDEAENETGE